MGYRRKRGEAAVENDQGARNKNDQKGSTAGDRPHTSAKGWNTIVSHLRWP